MATSAESEEVWVLVGYNSERCPRWFGNRSADGIPNTLRGVVTGAEWEHTRRTVMDAYYTFYREHGCWFNVATMGTWIAAIVLGVVFNIVIIFVTWLVLAGVMWWYAYNSPLRKKYFPEAQAVLNSDIYGGALKMIGSTRSGIFLKIDIAAFRQHLAARQGTAPPAVAHVESPKTAVAVATPIDIESGVMDKRALL